MTSQRIREAYESQDRLARVLHTELKRFLGRSLPDRWFTASRVKSFESFEQKVESGLVQDPSNLEDFVAAMVVVPSIDEIDAAIGFVAEFFTMRYRRPSLPNVTEKSASSFVFDDLRMYGTLRADPALPSRPIDEVVFEIQIKTFLQHAWSIATHDVVYKHDVVSWRRSRVAFMVKALLEQAEVSIGAIDSIQHVESLPEFGEPEASTQTVIAAVVSQWLRGDLPRDLRRVSGNLLRVGAGVGLDASGIVSVLDQGRRGNGGAHPVGLSPYEALIEYLSFQRPDDLRGLLRGERSVDREFALYVSESVLQRLGLSEASASRAVV